MGVEFVINNSTSLYLTAGAGGNMFFNYKWLNVVSYNWRKITFTEVLLG